MSDKNNGSDAQSIENPENTTETVPAKSTASKVGSTAANAVGATGKAVGNGIVGSVSYFLKEWVFSHLVCLYYGQPCQGFT
ncbi:MAG: hypothetical protein ACI9TY_000759 [Alphaproteobacteria bacterium]|jgi:hypothetical protein